jgi:hypothetical protein
MLASTDILLQKLGAKHPPFASPAVSVKIFLHHMRNTRDLQAEA